MRFISTVYDTNDTKMKYITAMIYINSDITVTQKCKTTDTVSQSSSNADTICNKIPPIWFRSIISAKSMYQLQGTVKCTRLSRPKPVCLNCPLGPTQTIVFRYIRQEARFPIFFGYIEHWKMVF